MRFALFALILAAQTALAAAPPAKPWQQIDGCRWKADRWNDGDSFHVITGEPNELVAPIHDRMPVILPREKYAAWLDLATPSEPRAALLVPFPAEQMRAYPISPRVNTPRNDDPELIAPLDATLL